MIQHPDKDTDLVSKITRGNIDINTVGLLFTGITMYTVFTESVLGKIL